jgi:hypothetical protein
VTEYPDHLAIARKLLEQQGEINDLRERAEAAEAQLVVRNAAIAAVAVQAAEWAALAPVDDWGNGPQDAVLADVGRHLQRLMATQTVPTEEAPACS